MRSKTNENKQRYQSEHVLHFRFIVSRDLKNLIENYIQYLKESVPMNIPDQFKRIKLEAFKSD